MKNSISVVIGLTWPCICAAFIIHSALQFSKGKKENRYFTSSWIFFSFRFGSELAMAFDLPPSKLMYKPPSSFILMPGSMRLDISFLKQIGKRKNSSGQIVTSHFSVSGTKSADALYFIAGVTFRNPLMFTRLVRLLFHPWMNESELHYTHNRGFLLE